MELSDCRMIRMDIGHGFKSVTLGKVYLYPVCSLSEDSFSFLLRDELGLEFYTLNLRVETNWYRTRKKPRSGIYKIYGKYSNTLMQLLLIEVNGRCWMIKIRMGSAACWQMISGFIRVKEAEAICEVWTITPCKYISKLGISLFLQFILWFFFSLYCP